MRSSLERPAGVILAGGESTRMGADKSMLLLNGRPFIQHIAETMQQELDSVLISANDERTFQFLNLPVIPDIIRGCGPMSGIHAVFAQTAAEKIFIAPCDMPLLNADTIRMVIDQSQDVDAVVLRSSQKLQPLCGLYARSCVSVLEQRMSRGQYSMMGLLENISTLIVSSTTNNDDELLNINTPQEYAELRGNPAILKHRFMIHTD